MLKKTFTILLMGLSATAIAMDKNSIVISTVTKKSFKTDISVNDKTTVLDIKTALQDSEGIPVDQQLLLAQYREHWYSLSSSNSPSLTNSTLIKSAMKIFNTNQFLLWLMLKPKE